MAILIKTSSPTEIKYVIPEPAIVSVAVHNPEGRLLQIIANSFKPAGSHTITWNCRNATGQRITSGVYYINISVIYTTLSKRSSTDGPNPLTRLNLSVSKLNPHAPPGA
jgi:hypothetical protein